MPISLWCLLIACRAATVDAAVTLPALISDNMVLQRGRPIPIWGWADKGEEVTVAAAGQTVSTKAGDDRRWEAVLDTLDVGRPLEMTVKGSSGSNIVVKNILVGEVWLCSGQSNMHWTLSPGHGVINNEAELAAAKYPAVRQFTVGKGSYQGSPEPVENAEGAWLAASRENLLAGGGNGASAWAYFFGRDLHKVLWSPRRAKSEFDWRVPGRTG